MLKGETTEVTAGVVIFVFTILSITLFVANFLVSIDIDIRTSEEKLNAVEMAHLIKNCLSQGDIVDSALLEQNRGKRFSEFAGLQTDCKRDVFVEVEDIESGTVWAFGDRGEYSHEIFVPLDIGDEVRLGRLYVSI